MKQVTKPCEHVKALMEYLEKERLGVDYYFVKGSELDYRCERCDEVVSSFYVENPEG